MALWDFDDGDDFATDEFPDELDDPSESEMESMLLRYRDSQDELLGRVPLPAPSEVASMDDIDLYDTIIEDDASSSEDDEEEPACGIFSATYCYILGVLAGVLKLGADALYFAAQQRYTAHVTTSNGYMASKKLMVRDDMMIVDCGATKHCVPNASELSKVTDPDPRHAVKVGNGERLEVTQIGEMQTKVNTMTPVTCKGEVVMRSGVETMLLKHVLVVPDMACALFSCIQV